MEAIPKKEKVRMKSRLLVWMFAVTLGLLALVFSGCYTQFNSTREEEGEGYTSQPENSDSSYVEDHDRNDSGYRNYSDYDNYGYGGGYSHSHVGFSYYYPSSYWPSYAFTAAYNDPWCYDN